DTVQYREKRALPRHVRRAMGLRITAAIGASRCIVNDDVDVARAIGARGVHLGPQDRSPQEVRQLWPEVRCIGATANNLERAIHAVSQGVDYLGVGPVYPTSSKARPAPVLGLEGLRRIVAAVDCPVIAIGGIDSRNVGEVLATGAWGVAVLSCVVAAADPRAAAARMRERIDRCLAGGLAV
ncbi:MAG: thiamine phosphate synthase, partial [Acidobacteria bacterium]|nr:thiamine phosphate synthase [Acidobacteriota bacterium]NIQ87533.1 thiamine phosphate synthase [Acidobacteriota bacterium]